MKQSLLAVFCVSLTLYSVPAKADDPKPTPALQDIPAGADKIVVVRKGDPAPFEGQLFDNPTALRWGNWLLQYKFRLASDVGYERKLREADVALWEHKLEISEQKYSVVAADYQQKIASLDAQLAKYKEQVDNPPWYRSPFVGFAAGALFTGMCVGVGVYAAHR